MEVSTLPHVHGGRHIAVNVDTVQATVATTAVFRYISIIYNTPKTYAFSPHSSPIYIPGISELHQHQLSQDPHSHGGYIFV